MTQPFLYSVEREFPVSLERLFLSWTDPSELESWYHPVGLHSVVGSTASQLHIGGLWSCGVDVQVHNFAAYFFGKYTKLVKNELIEHTMHYTESAEVFKAKDFNTPSHEIVINFESRGANSWVKFAQYGEIPEGQEAQAQAGMESYLDSLGAFLAQRQTRANIAITFS